MGIDYEFYTQEIKFMSLSRKCIAVCRQGLSDASKKDFNPAIFLSDIHSKFDMAEGNLYSKTTNILDVVKTFKEDRSLLEEIELRKKRKDSGLSNYQGVCSGYPILDETLGSFQKGATYYIGARSSMGKTTFMLNLIKNMLDKYRIGIFSLEMDLDIITMKIASILTDLKYNQLSSGDLTQVQLEQFKLNLEALNKSSVFLEGPKPITIHKLRSRAKRMKENFNIDILFIDYLTRIQPSGDNFNKHLEVDEVSKGLQSLAKELEIPIVCFAQLNRASTGRKENGKVLPPTLVDFRESGSIEEDCDGAIFLHRPDYYDPLDHPGQIKVIIAKNRLEGTLKTIEYSCISSISERYKEQPKVKDQLPQPAPQIEINWETFS